MLSGPLELWLLSLAFIHYSRLVESEIQHVYLECALVQQGFMKSSLYVSSLQEEVTWNMQLLELYIGHEVGGLSSLAIVFT